MISSIKRPIISHRHVLLFKGLKNKNDKLLVKCSTVKLLEMETVTLYDLESNLFRISILLVVSTSQNQMWSAPQNLHLGRLAQRKAWINHGFEIKKKKVYGKKV